MDAANEASIDPYLDLFGGLPFSMILGSPTNIAGSAMTQCSLVHFQKKGLRAPGLGRWMGGMTSSEMGYALAHWTHTQKHIDIYICISIYLYIYLCVCVCIVLYDVKYVNPGLINRNGFLFGGVPFQ